MPNCESIRLNAIIIIGTVVLHISINICLWYLQYFLGACLLSLWQIIAANFNEKYGNRDIVNSKQADQFEMTNNNKPVLYDTFTDLGMVVLYNKCILSGQQW